MKKNYKLFRSGLTLKRILLLTVLKVAVLAFIMLMHLDSNAGVVSIDGSTTIKIDPLTSFSVQGDITLQNTAAIDNSGEVQLTGNWTNDGYGLINLSPGTVLFNGQAAQNIGGTASTIFNNLTLKNGNSAINNNVTLSADITVNGILAFDAANHSNLVTNSSKVVVSSTGTVSGASASTGWVNGNLQKNYSTNSGAQTFQYDIGDAAVYAPASLNIRNVNTSSNPVNITGYIATTDANENVPTVNASGIDQNKKANRYWFITENSGAGTFGDYDITLDFTNCSPTGNTANYVIRKFDPSVWVSTNSTVAGNTITASALTNFSDFETGELLFVSVPQYANADKIFNVFPNPSNNLITLNFMGAAVANYQLVVLDELGRQVLVKDGSAVKGLNTTKLDLSALAKGSYVINLKTSEQESNARIVVE